MLYVQNVEKKTSRAVKMHMPILMSSKIHFYLKVKKAICPLN